MRNHAVLASMEAMDFDVEFDRIAETVDISSEELQDRFGDLDRRNEIHAIDRKQFLAVIGSALGALMTLGTVATIQNYIENVQNFRIR